SPLVLISQRQRGDRVRPVDRFRTLSRATGTLDERLSACLRRLPASARRAARSVWSSPHRCRIARGRRDRGTGFRAGWWASIADRGPRLDRPRCVWMPDVWHQGQRGVVPDVAPGGYEWLDVLRRRGRPNARDVAGGGRSPTHRLAHSVRSSVLVDLS